MKLNGRDAKSYFKKPDPAAKGLLIFGADTMRVATARKTVIEALAGPEASAEMRLTQIAASDLRREPALLQDAIKAQGFFPGARVVHVESATDGLAKVFAAAFEDWQEGDAQIIVTSGSLTAKSALRKLFEGEKRAFSAGLYDDPPGRDEIEEMLKASGIANLDPAGMDVLIGLSRSLEPHDLAQTIEKVSLFKGESREPVTPEDIENCAPRTYDVELDALLNAVAEQEHTQIGLLMSRLYAQGTNPVSVCLGLSRHFKALFTIASDPGGPGAGIGKLRPPVFGPRRDRLMNHARRWGHSRIENAISILVETDLLLRSNTPVAASALMERTAMRLAMMARG